MAEEQGGLSYTIRFIPDTTAIDEMVTGIAKRVEDEIGQAIRKARVTAGVEEGVPAGDVSVGGVGVVDRIISEFRSVKERITGMMQKYGFLAGEAMALGHPRGRTLGGVMERLREKLTVTPLEELSEDLRLLIGGAMTVVEQRIKAMRELHPELSKEEATKMAMGEQIGAMTNIAGDQGFKQYMTMKSLAEVIRLADHYGRTLVEAGKGAEATVLKALVTSLTHKFVAEVGTAKLGAEGPAPDWEAEEITWRATYRRMGATEEQIDEWGIPERIRAADLFKIVDGQLVIVEFKTAGEGKEFSRDIGMAHKLYQKIIETPLMRETVEEMTGLPMEEIGLEAILATAGVFGSVEAVVEAEAIGRDGLATEVIDLGDEIRNAIKASLQPELKESEGILEILDGIHKILVAVGTSPTSAVSPSGLPKGSVDELFDRSTGGEE